MTALIAWGWVLVLATAWPAAFAWLIGPGSLLHQLLPGTQHYMGTEGIEGVWFLATLPVLIWLVGHEEGVQ